MVREWLSNLWSRFEDRFQDEEDEDFIEILGSRMEHGSWKCNICSKKGIQKKYPDLYRHIYSNHGRVVEEDDGENEDGYSRGSRNRVKKRNLLDSYSLERPESDSEEVEIQEPSGGSDLKISKLRVYYERILSEIENRGKFQIRESTHIGSVRGGHIKQKFKMAVRRVEDDSLDNYIIENDGGGDYPIIIERRN